MDLLIQGGLIVDGSGEKPYYADLAVERDKISAIGKFDAADARKVVDATGLIVTPGLIDGHTHSELSLLKNRQHPNAVYQGISTVVTGQCGLGFAPMKPEQLEDSIRINSGIFGDYRHYFKPWQTFGEFLDLLDGSAVNVAANVSHNAVRQMVCGFENKVLGEEELAAAKQVLAQAMEEGAVGLSVGLSYYPGGYSDTNEVAQLCSVVKEYDGLFCVHQRLNDGQIPISSLEESAEIVRRTGVRMNMLHYRTGGMEDYHTLFAPFEELEKAGASITYEYYPYLVGAGLLLALVPGWVQEGSADAILDRLTSEELRPQLLREMEERHSYFFGPGQTARIILTKDPYSRYLGKTVDEIAAEHGETFSEAVIRLLVDNDLEAGFAGVENQTPEMMEKLYDDQYKLFLDERYSIGSDTIPAGLLCHPRAFGSFSRIISRMRDRNVPVEYIIKKLTSMPAKIYRLEGRGLLKPGMQADICLMDYERVQDMATFADSRRRPEGVHSLYVNGLPAMENGTLTGILAGRAVRRGVQ
ncbi:MAG: amidohydrolase family protein [Candidatus Limivivens sp.]|nr:amidohydrolase family protein [Candidatus Limivivens sp.]